MTPPRIFDRRTYGLRRARTERAGAQSLLVEDVTDNLCLRIAAMRRTFGRALDLQSRSQSFERLRPLAETWVRTAFAPACETVVADEEALPFAEKSFDLVTSVLSLHAANDVPGALIQIRRALAPGGLFVAGVFAGATLQEMRRAFAAAEAETSGGISPRVAPFADVRDWGALLHRAGFAMPVADTEQTIVRYGDFFTLVRDLRALGETNALAERRRTPLRRDTLASAAAHYLSQYGEPDGRMRATFEVVYLTGWA